MTQPVKTIDVLLANTPRSSIGWRIRNCTATRRSAQSRRRSPGWPDRRTHANWCRLAATWTLRVNWPPTTNPSSMRSPNWSRGGRTGHQPPTCFRRGIRIDADDVVLEVNPVKAAKSRHCSRDLARMYIRYAERHGWTGRADETISDLGATRTRR